MTAQKMSAQEIIAFIGNAEKKTNVKVTFEGELATAVPASVTKLGNVLFGDWKDIEPLLANLTENKDYVVEQDGRNSAGNQSPKAPSSYISIPPASFSSAGWKRKSMLFLGCT